MTRPPDVPAMPWSRIMQLCLGQMAMRPDDFWRLTVPELAAIVAARVPRSDSGPDRNWLEEAMKIYPDSPKEIRRP